MATIAHKLGEQLGLTRAKNVCYGELNGYAVSLRDFGNQILVDIGASFSSEEEKWTCANEISQIKMKKLVETKSNGAGIALRFNGGMGAQKQIAAFIEQLWPVLERHGAKGAAVCPLCGLDLSSTARAWAKIDDSVYCAHGSCLDKRVQQAEEENREAKMQKKNVLPGTVGAFVGALVGTIPWIIIYCLGYLVVWCGFFIGAASKKGYELLGGKPGKLKPWIVVLFTLLSLPVCFVAANYIYAIFEYYREGYADYGWALSDYTAFVWEVLKMPDFWVESARDLIISLIFSIVGCVGVFKEMHDESRGPGERVVFITDRTGANVG